MTHQTLNATLLLLLIVSSTAIDIRNDIANHLNYLRNNLVEEGVNDVHIKNDNSEKVKLTLHEIQEIKSNLNEQLNFKDSPVLFEVNSFTPVDFNDASPETLEQHHNEITNILAKATVPLGELATLFDMDEGSNRHTNDINFIESGRRFGPSKIKSKLKSAYKYSANAVSSAADTVYSKVTDESEDHKKAGGSCVKTNRFMTCGGNEECRPDPSNPCKGLCQCNTDNINNCECVQQLEFPNSMSSALDDTNSMGKAMTVPGAAWAAIFGFVDGFLGGMLTDFTEPWKTDENCANLKDDFSSGLKSILHSFKHLLHTVKTNVKRVLTSSSSRKRIVSAIKRVLVSILDFLGSVTVGLWKCPATKMIVITIGVIGAAISANAAFLAAGLVVVPLIIKWVGAIVGLYFSFQHLKHLIGSLSKNIGLIRENKCHKKCKETIVEKSFGVAGCLTEVVLMGAIGDVLDFGLKNPSKVKAAAAGSKPAGGRKFKVSWNNDMIHDIRVLKIAASNSKHKAGKSLTKVFKKFKSGSKQAQNALPPPPKKVGHVTRSDDFYKSTKRLGGIDNPVKDMDEAAALMKKNKFSCDAAENGPKGRNPILDDAKAKKGKIPDEDYKKEIQSAKNNAESFHNGEYNVVVLDEPITLYRAGPDDRALGQFWTRTPPKNQFEVRYNAAVKQEWSNIEAVYKVEIPAGTPMYEGYVASQGGKFVGQGKQIFIKKPWELPGVTKNVKKIGTFDGPGKGFDYITGALRHLPSLASSKLTRKLGKMKTRVKRKQKSSDSGGIDKIVANACANKRWHGVIAKNYGTCENVAGGIQGQCADGLFISKQGYCSDSQTKCCLRKPCGEGDKGFCTYRHRCNVLSGKKKFLSGLCPGPSHIRCCYEG
jgi:hypothetical protein